jgi:signal transduction histidine kinase
MMPRRSIRIRVRLTALYGGLFLIFGAVLLTIAYVLVLRSVPGDVLFARGADGAVLVGRSEAGLSAEDSGPRSHVLHGLAGSERPAMQSRARELRARAVDRRRTDLRRFLMQSWSVFAALAVMSTTVGWFVAGGLLARLESAFRAQRQFVANASHELRTPLARQRTLIQVALSDPEATAESLRAVHERVLVANHQQWRLLDALLTLAQSEVGLNRRVPLDLSRITEQALLAIEPEVARRRLQLHVTLDRAPIAGDPRLVERMIANLVDNAVRHNRPAGHIEVRTCTTNGKVVFFVANSGPFIPPSDVDRLFQPFQRLGETPGPRRVDDGLGLGLSIVQAVSVAHEAAVTARARTEGGLEVTVVFPGA